MITKLLLSTDIIKLNDNADMSQGCAVAVGGFDGVHRGHRQLLAALVAEARRLKLPAVVFTFHSKDSPKAANELLALPEKKLSLLKDPGVDVVLSARFSQMRDVSAADFAKEYLAKHLGAKTVLCGYDFRFGKGRSGSADLISALLIPMGVSVITPNPVLYGEGPISSTAIRLLISQGEMVKANRMLGRSFSFSSQIVHGAKLGRELGFPTINQAFPEGLVKPRFGVYAVKVMLENKEYGGVANFGIKPTVGGKDPLCETYIFDYSGDCYGKTAEICFEAFIRPEKRFSSVEELKAQIASDRESAQKILAKENIYI